MSAYKEIIVIPNRFETSVFGLAPLAPLRERDLAILIETTLVLFPLLDLASVGSPQDWHGQKDRIPCVSLALAFRLLGSPPKKLVRLNPDDTEKK